jgi:predicted secreted protein
MLSYQSVDLTEMVLNEQHHNQQVTLAYQDTIAVELTHQSGTGYYWVWNETDGSAKALKLLDEKSISSQNTLGGKSTQRFLFSVVAKGKYELHLDLKRSWEDSILQTYSVHLLIE